MYLYVCITDVDFHNRFYHLKVKSYSLVHFNAAVDFVVEGAGHEGIWFHLTLGIVHGCKKMMKGQKKSCVMNIGKATSGFMFSVGVNQNLNIEIQIILNIEI